MKAVLISIGDEILIGQVINTNVSWLSTQLADVGVEVIQHITVGDTKEHILDTLTLACNNSDLIIITGGLGPTKDDITKSALATFLNVGMYFDNNTFERIKNIFEKLGKTLSPLHLDQCLMPETAKILINRMGTAPGMLFEYNGTRIFSLPGVPFEMKAIMEDHILPLLKEEQTQSVIYKTILTATEGETNIENRIADIVADMPIYIKIAYLPSLAQVRLRITGINDNKSLLADQINDISANICAKLSDIVFGFDNSTLENEIQNLFIKKNLTLSIAESCTGGHICDKIVSIPGSSAYFLGGIVSYDNSLKVNILGVDKNLIAQNGAVSENVVCAMVDGVLNATKANIGLAISGIAGPSGGNPEKPVGTIWIAVGNKNSKSTYLLKSGKDRVKNIEIASIYALHMLFRFTSSL